MRVKTLAGLVVSSVAALAASADLPAGSATRALEVKQLWGKKNCNGKDTCRVDLPSAGAAGKILNASCNFSSSEGPGAGVYPTAVVLGFYDPIAKKFTEAAYPAPVAQLSYSPEAKYQVLSATLLPIKSTEQAAIRVDFTLATDIEVFCSVSGEFVP